MSLVPLHVTNIVTSTDATIQVFTGACCVGMAIINAAAAASTVRIYDGTADTDPLVFYAQAPANSTEGVAGGRIWCVNGCYVVTTGAGSTAQVGIE